MHDLDAIAGRELAGRIAVAWHDLLVDLDRDPPGAEAEVREELGDAAVGLEVARLAVHDYAH